MKQVKHFLTLLIVIAIASYSCTTDKPQESGITEINSTNEEIKKTEFKEIRAVIDNNIEEENIRIFYTEILNSSEESFNKGDTVKTKKLLDGLVNISFALEDKYISNEIAAKIILAIENDAIKDEVPVITKKLFEKRKCNNYSGDGRCDIEDAEWDCWEIYERGKFKGCQGSKR